MDRSTFSRGRVLLVYLHVEGELQLGLSVRVVDLEETVNELLKVDVAARVQIKHREEALANDSGKLAVLETGQRKTKGCQQGVKICVTTCP